MAALLFEKEIWERIFPRFENAAGAQVWYFSAQIPGFSGLTAKQLVEAGRGREVLEYLDAVDAGLFS